MRKFLYLLLFLAVSLKWLSAGSIDYSLCVKAITDIQYIKTAIMLYKFDHHNYPRNITELVNATGKVSGEHYLKKYPVDPWGTIYKYKLGLDNKEYSVYSIGKNGTDNMGKLDDVSSSSACDATSYRLNTAINYFIIIISIIILGTLFVEFRKQKEK